MTPTQRKYYKTVLAKDLDKLRKLRSDKHVVVTTAGRAVY